MRKRLSEILGNYIRIERVILDTGMGLDAMILADMHVHGFGRREEELEEVLKSASEEVDVIFVLGDTYDERTKSLEPIYRILGRVNKPKFGVLGNHEHWADPKIPIPDGIRVLERAGVTLLLDRAVEYRGIRIGGVDWYEDDTIGRKLRELGKVDLLLSHTPDIIELNPDARVVLAGHTHGGQVCFPVIGPIWTPSKYGRRYASGLFSKGGSYLYVSRGLGEMNPIRINCPRELTLMRI
ncbi:metallophosphoesterase [Candidatus Korarchaeum cryptofilum]|jgi:predicted MPP superfamily phosphohydrolase|uniref:Metallophosphoesterase n=2 Tax=Candidatus Korarchaeum cryptofilum TaxID=498846 RepID=B1L3B4_KORCO|nr:metallophosphoesterase [Candidatus Korarchaeum cryptofilum]ACB06943.1 metallophosphoesterase [Candidatus Korarchaeum cryptofilum OPF8]RSN67145.1 metallophosphoesterase [Candidatus Korarchaeum cryptofilum]